jgi:methylmalonyl-CoA mutase C-terminal domain/subunit
MGRAGDLIPRVLVAKPGLDGHDRGVYLIARVLRDAGMEVVYTGLRQTPAQIAAAARDDDVQVVGLSILAGGHLGLASKVIAELAALGVEDIAVVVGGVIPQEDVQQLLDLGVAAVFPSSTPLEEVVEQVQALADERLHSAA